MSRRRIVVTGMGMVTPIGNTVKTAWESLIQGKSGIRLIESFDTSDFTTKIAGNIRNFDPTQYLSAKEARKFDEFIQYGVAAATQAIEDSGLQKDESLNKDRVGILVGSGIGGLNFIESNHSQLIKSGPRRISPFFIPGTIINLVAGQISIMYGYKGPSFSAVSACTTAAHNIGTGMRLIAYGDADVIIAGGAECACTPLGLGGFAAMRALSTRNDEPEKASRPWDKDRDGFVLGDGAGILVLEELNHAKKRGAQIYAELAGFGMSTDAFHITRPIEGGAGAAASMMHALKDAELNPDTVNYINAHGTSTPAGDTEEVSAVKTALGMDAAKRVMMSSSKSMTGHLLGAAGAIEAIFSILAIQNNIAPPTINLDNPDEGCDLDLVPHRAKEAPINVAMSNSFGFGGTNGTLIFKRFNG